METPMVTLPHVYDAEDYLKMLVMGETLFVREPRQVSANGKVFNKKTGGVRKRIVQNIGTTPIFFWIQTEAPVDYAGTSDVSPPHGVITPDTGDKAGFGGQVDFANYNNPIWLGNTSSNFNALILEAFNSEPHSTGDVI